MTNCTETHKLPLDGRNLDTIGSIDISCADTRSERSIYENNLTLGANDHGPKPGPMKHRPDFSRAVHTLAAMKHQEGKTNPKIPKHLRERQRTSTTIGHSLLLRQHDGVHKSGKHQQWQGWREWQEQRQLLRVVFLHDEPLRR